VSQRTELVAATISEPSFKEREAVMRFNKYNPDYYITFKTYLDEDYHTDDRKEKVRLARQSFNNDLVSGKGADIYFSPYGELDFENLGQKGALADLYEFIDADSDISRDDFVQSILKAMEYKGKLYAVSPDFSLNTIVGKKSLLGQYDKWDYNAVYELAKSHPDAILFANSNQEKNLDKFMAYSLDMFYNSDTAECGFDSEQFIKLLELAKGSGTEYDNSADIGELLTDEKVLLYEAPIIFFVLMGAACTNQVEDAIPVSGQPIEFFVQSDWKEIPNTRLLIDDNGTMKFTQGDKVQIFGFHKSSQWAVENVQFMYDVDNHVDNRTLGQKVEFDGTNWNYTPKRFWPKYGLLDFYASSYHQILLSDLSSDRLPDT
jgi:hypothetical protein